MAAKNSGRCGWGCRLRRGRRNYRHCLRRQRRERRCRHGRGRRPRSRRACRRRVGAVSRGRYEARVRELIKRTDFVFAMMIETMLDVRRAIFDGYSRLHRVVLPLVQRDPICRRFDDRPVVGPVAALSFKVAVDDPLRIIRSRTVASLLLHVRKWSTLRTLGPSDCLAIAHVVRDRSCRAQARRHPASHVGRR